MQYLVFSFTTLYLGFPTSKSKSITNYLQAVLRLKKRGRDSMLLLAQGLGLDWLTYLANDHNSSALAELLVYLGPDILFVLWHNHTKNF